ncbi:MAG: hypothetical protein HUJ51_02535 [Eggerthellaceae bacterium]|nr:hypothetical protein [Eggerthellaceae bacterium]
MKKRPREARNRYSELVCAAKEHDNQKATYIFWKELCYEERYSVINLKNSVLWAASCRLSKGGRKIHGQ